MSKRKLRQDVREHLEGYSGAAASLDIDEYLTFFTDDAVMHGILEMFGQTGPLVGKEALRGFFGPAFDGLEWLTQLNSITNIDIGEDEETATASLGVQERAGGANGEILMLGRYDDRLVLTDEGWKFKERRLTVYKFRPVTGNPAA
ncbi:MAG: nuclear transport factor 2 family protein [Alphaproteobacteria bacterium]|nr:nuclear transport factor 2 family protein [Alphaproteobacteria bacterium]